MVSLRGRTWDEIYGPERAQELRDLKSRQRSGKSPEEIWAPEVAARIRRERSERRLGKTYQEIYGDRSQEEVDKRTRLLTRDSKRVRDWSNSVRKRDSFTCQECGYREMSSYIVAHHIKSWDDFPDLRLDLNNGKTLCRPCHRVEHAK